MPRTYLIALVLRSEGIAEADPRGGKTMVHLGGLVKVPATEHGS
jgi:hypothetical protein